MDFNDEEKRFIKYSIFDGINGVIDIIDKSRPLDEIRKRKIKCDSVVHMYEHCKPEFGFLTRDYYQANRDNRDCICPAYECKSILKYYYNKYSFLQNKYFIKSGSTYSRGIYKFSKRSRLEYHYYTFGEIEYDYDFIKKTKEPLNKEFIAWYYHPSRINGLAI